MSLMGTWGLSMDIPEQKGIKASVGPSESPRPSLQNAVGNQAGT